MEVPVAAAAGMVDESVLVQGTSTAVSKTAANLSLAKLGPLVTTIVGGAVVMTTLLSAVTIVGILVATSTPFPPVAVPDSYTAHKNNVYLLNVLDNDYDTRNINVTIESVEQPPYGRVEIVDSSVQLRYFAPHGYTGQEAFNYTITNGRLTASAEVTIDVLNIPPETVDIRYEVSKGAEQFRANLFDYVTESGRRILDLDNDTLTISEITQPSMGSAVISSDGRSILYDAPDKSGAAIMTYTVTDGYDQSTSRLVFSVENDAPVAVDDEYLKLKKDTVDILSVLDNDSDPNGDDIHIEKVFNICPGVTITLSPSDGNATEVIIYPSRRESLLHPDDRYPDRRGCAFQYTITDGDLRSTATVYATFENALPTIEEDVLVVEKNLEGSIPLRLSDADLFDTVTCEIEKEPSHGVARLESTASHAIYEYLVHSSRNVTTYNYTLFYTPNLNSMEGDSVTLRISDGYDFINAVIPIHVQNTAPIANDDSNGEDGNFDVYCLKTAGCSIDFDVLLSNDEDPNGDKIDIDTDFVSSTDGVSVEFDADSRKVHFVPAPGKLTGSFTYRVTDILSNPSQPLVSNEATVSLTLVNEPPVAVNHKFEVYMDTDVILDILDGCSDPNGDALEINSVGPTVVDETSVEIVDQGKGVKYTPPKFVTGDSFTYTVRDDGSLTSLQHGIVDISVINRPPSANEIHTETHWRRSDPLEIDISSAVSDLDGHDVVLSSISYDGSDADISIRDDKTIQFKPRSSIEIGVLTFYYTVTDEFDTASSVVHVEIKNTPPSAGTISESVHHSNSICMYLPNDATDADGDEVSLVAITSQPGVGSARISGTSEGRCILYEAAGVTGLFSIEYSVSDTKSTSVGVATVEVTNTAPVASPVHAKLHWRSALSTHSKTLYSPDASDNDADPISLVGANTVSGEGSAAVEGDRISVTFSSEPSSPPQSWIEGNRETTVRYTVSDGCDTASSELKLEITNAHVPSFSEDLEVSFHWREVQNSEYVSIDPLEGKTVDGDGDAYSLESASTTPPAQVSITGTRLSFTMGESDVVGEPVPITVTVSDGLDKTIRTVLVTATNTPPETGPEVKAIYRYVNFRHPIDINLLDQATDADLLDVNNLEIVSCQVESPDTRVSPHAEVYESGCKFKASDCSNDGPFIVKYYLTDGRTEVSNTISIDCDDTKVSVEFRKHWSQVVAPGKTLDILTQLKDNGDIDEGATIIGISKSPADCDVDVADEDSIQFTFSGTTRSNLGEKVVDVELSGFNNIPVTVTVYNSAPVCKPFSLSGHWRDLQDSPSAINIGDIVSDQDEEFDQVKFKLDFEGGAHGNVDVQPDKIQYTLTDNFAGTITIRYTATDGFEDCTNVITIKSENTPPTALDMSQDFHWRTVVDGTASINVLAGSNDDDDDVVFLKEGSHSGWDNNWAALNVDNNAGTFSIQKPQSEISEIIGQSATVTYVLTDGVAEVTKTAKFSVINSKPIAGPAEFNVPATSRITGGFEIDLSDIFDDQDNDDMDHLKLKSVIDSSTSGVVEKLDDHRVKYTPPKDTGESFEDSFRYTITDGAQESDAATIKLNVINTPPKAKRIEERVETRNTRTFNVVSHGCEDVDGGDNLLLNYRFSDISSKGKVYGILKDDGNGQVTYEPTGIPFDEYDSNDEVVMEWSFTCRDAAGSTAHGEIVIIVKSVPPRVKPLSTEVNRVESNGPNVSYDIFAEGGVETDGGLVTLKSVSYSGARGKVSHVPGSGTIEFTPMNLGVDTTEVDVIYTVTDGYRDASEKLSIKFMNVLPKCTDSPVHTLQKSSVTSFNADSLYKPVDDNGDPIRFSFSTNHPGLGATVTMTNPATGDFRISTAQRRSGTLEFGLRLSDGSSELPEPQCEVTFNVENRKPVVTDTSSSVSVLRKRGVQTIPIEVKGSDPDAGDSVSVDSNSLESSCGYRSLRTENPLSILFEPLANQAGSCIITYKLIDNDQNNPKKSDEATVTVYFTEAEPVANNDTVYIDQGALGEIHFDDLLANDKDYNNDGLEFDIEYFKQNGCPDGYCRVKPVLGNRRLYYQASSDDCDSDYFRYRVKSRNAAGVYEYSEPANVTIRLQECTCSQPLDIVLVVDGSGSISSGEWDEIRNFNTKLLERLTISNEHVRVGLVQFATSVFTKDNKGFSLSEDPEFIEKSIDNLKQDRGWTNTRGGLRAALDMLENNGREDVAKVVVVLTDGDANRPCSCDQCSSLGRGLGSDENMEGNQVCDAIGSRKWNGRTCGRCGGTNCMPCADPTYESDYMTSLGIKVVAFGVGDGLSQSGKEIVRNMHFEKTFIRARWKDDDGKGGSSDPTLEQLMGKIVDMSCRDNH